MNLFSEITQSASQRYPPKGSERKALLLDGGTSTVATDESRTSLNFGG
jgi:hypothetical protein